MMIDNKSTARAVIFAVVVIALASACNAEKKGAAVNSVPRIMLVQDINSESVDSFSKAAFIGILRFYGETWNNQTNRGRLYNVRRCPTGDDFAPLVRAAAAEQKWDIIVTMGFTFAGAIMEAAPLYPQQNFMIIEVDWMSYPNVMQYTFAEHEGSYLVGAAIALKSIEDGIDDPVFGFLGGIPSAVITRFEVGYIQGIWSILPDAKIVDVYVNSWDLPELAEVPAREWYENGVYGIYPAAGASGNGVINMAKEFRRQGENVWAMGVDSDQYDDGLYAPSTSAVLTSMLKKIDSATEAVLTTVQNHTFTGNTAIALDLAQGGVDFTTTNQALGPAIVKRLNQIKGDIIAKRIVVVPTYRDSLRAGLVPAGLLASDD
jgi:basic membrane protein A